MTVQEFLENRLKNRREYKLSPKDQRKLSQDVEGFILDRVTSGKYRKTKIDPDTLTNLKTKIHAAVKENKPIQFTFPFGGYKLHSLESYPTVDWAEFFTFAYFSDYLNQISQHYAPGVIFTFVSDEAIVGKMNNIPQESLEKYTETFKKLLDLFNTANPKNLIFKFQRVRDLYNSEEELWNELNSYFEETKDNWKNFDDKKKASRRKMVLLNYNFDKEPAEEELDAFLSKNTQLHDSYMKLTKRRGFTRGPDKIVVFSFTIPDSVTLGATKYSAAKFWTGFGVLKSVSGEGYQDLVLTPEQLKDQTYKTENVDLVKLPNFDTIRIYN